MNFAKMRTSVTITNRRFCRKQAGIPNRTNGVAQYHPAKPLPNRAAIEMYQKAFELDSKSLDARYGLGMTYLQTNNKSAAMQQYEQLKQLNAEYADKLLAEINRQE